MPKLISGRQTPISEKPSITIPNCIHMYQLNNMMLWSPNATVLKNPQKKDSIWKPASDANTKFFLVNIFLKQINIAPFFPFFEHYTWCPQKVHLLLTKCWHGKAWKIKATTTTPSRFSNHDPSISHHFSNLINLFTIIHYWKTSIVFKCWGLNRPKLSQILTERWTTITSNLRNNTSQKIP